MGRWAVAEERGGILGKERGGEGRRRGVGCSLEVFFYVGEKPL